MAVMRCPECKKQREVEAIGTTTAIFHPIERRYRCLDCGITFEKPVGAYRRNRVYHEERPSRQVFELTISSRR